jgi:hypothetical protein
MTTIDNEIMPKLCLSYNCIFCDYSTVKLSSYKNHLNSIRHKNNVANNEIMPKLCYKFYCDFCQYKTDKKSSYNNHIKSIRHINNTANNEIMLKLCLSNNNTYICKKCNKSFNDRAGLWRHNKKCEKQPVVIEDKQNSEFKELIIEQNKQIIQLSKEKSISNCHNNK